MGKRRIHNIDTLEKEIYRLKLKASGMERKLEKNVHYLRSNALTLTLAALFSRKKESGAPPMSLGELLMRNEKVQETLAKATDAVAEKLSEGVDALVEKYLRKKEKQQEKEGREHDQTPDF